MKNSYGGSGSEVSYLLDPKRNFTLSFVTFVYNTLSLSQG